MNYDLSEFSEKDIVFIGRGREEVSFKAFVEKYTRIKSFQSIEITKENQVDYLKQLESLNLDSTVVVKGSEYPGRLVPVSYTTSTRVFFNCVKRLGAKVIGVTGTRGKSTTASLLYRMLQQGGFASLLGSDIGSPLLDLLTDANQQNIFVVELTSFELTELDVSPDMAVITNLSRDHIDYHGSLENYWEAKRNIVRYMTENDTVVFNPNSEIVFHWLAELDVKKVIIDTEEVADMSKSQLIGEHNKLNYIIAKAAAQELGVDLFSCQHILKNFKPLPHRLSKIREVKGITFMDNAIATQPEATVLDIKACIREVAPVGCVMLGGKDLGYDFSELVNLLSTLLIPKLILFPETAEKIKEILPAGYKPEIFETSDMHKAVMWASEHCPSGSVCLLSTASPSYSLWKNYEEKGDLFQKAVLELSN